MEKEPSANVAANARRLRQQKGWSLAQLSARLAELDHPLSIPVLSKIELGDRRIDVDDLVGLGAALEAQPADLLVDPELVVNERIVQLLEDYRHAAREAVALRREAEAIESDAAQRLRSYVAGDAATEAALRRELSATVKRPDDWFAIIMEDSNGER